MAEERNKSLDGRREQVEVREDEEVQDLLRDKMIILQKKNGYRFSVDPILLTSFIDLKKGDRVIDLGTGSGVIPLILAKQKAETDADFVGLEVQQSMANMAERSVAANQMEERIAIQHGDIRNIRKSFPADSFEVVISNPPYIPVDEGNLNPDDEKAVARHEVKVSLEEVIQAARYLVKPKGRIYFVYPVKRLIDLLCLCRESNLEPRQIQFVHANQASGAKLAMIKAMRDAGQDLKVCKPMIVYNMDGTYTQEVATILNEDNI